MLCCHGLWTARIYQRSRRRRRAASSRVDGRGLGVYPNVNVVQASAGLGVSGLVKSVHPRLQNVEKKRSERHRFESCGW